jgi:hypothetical protein
VEKEHKEEESRTEEVGRQVTKMKEEKKESMKWRWRRKRIRKEREVDEE